MLRTVRTLTLALIAATAMSACASEAPLSGERTLIATTGDLTIESPDPGDVFTPESVPVELRLTGAEILEEASQDVQPDTGHVHVKLDGETITLLAGLEFDLVDLLAEQRGGPQELEPGAHLLEVEFVAANHEVFSPREFEQMTFTVRRAKQK